MRTIELHGAHANAAWEAYLRNRAGVAEAERVYGKTHEPATIVFSIAEGYADLDADLYTCRFGDGAEPAGIKSAKNLGGASVAALLLSAATPQGSRDISYLHIRLKFRARGIADQLIDAGKKLPELKALTANAEAFRTFFALLVLMRNGFVGDLNMFTSRIPMPDETPSGNSAAIGFTWRPDYTDEVWTTFATTALMRQRQKGSLGAAFASALCKMLLASPRLVRARALAVLGTRERIGPIFGVAPSEFIAEDAECAEDAEDAEDEEEGGAETPPQQEDADPVLAAHSATPAFEAFLTDAPDALLSRYHGLVEQVARVTEASKAATAEAKLLAREVVSLTEAAGLAATRAAHEQAVLEHVTSCMMEATNDLIQWKKSQVPLEAARALLRVCGDEASSSGSGSVVERVEAVAIDEASSKQPVQESGASDSGAGSSSKFGKLWEKSAYGGKRKRARS